MFFSLSSLCTHIILCSVMLLMMRMVKLISDYIIAQRSNGLENGYLSRKEALLV